MFENILKQYTNGLIACYECIEKLVKLPFTRTKVLEHGNDYIIVKLYKDENFEKILTYTQKMKQTV